ncbi:MAG TPA: lytic murein transglycosylase [Xanthomonadaceae bacterium]|nr:lytic murein transglycosylase [Xanthomonadaceae bacterium]
MLALPMACSAATGFQACLAQLRGNALSRGVSEATYDRHVTGLEPDLSVLEALDAQPEFVTPIWDYMAGLVDEERVADGRSMLAEHADVLSRIRSRFGVDAETLVALWGVESDYGRVSGKRALVRSLATLSCMGRRQDFFRGEFVTSLRILEQGHVAPEALTGSWAGAFGHTQFMPSTFEQLAVDFDGDGRRDLVGSVADALASTANYLARSGWRTGELWGFEVRLPADFDPALAGRRNKRTLADWVRRGVTGIDGEPIVSELSAEAQAGLLLPAGIEGPAFLTLRNFDALYSYNAAESYALAIAHLSDRLRGRGPIGAPWPTDDPGLSRAQRRELQQLLVARGHEIGEVDGLIGSLTRNAIAAEQRRLGHAVDGRAGQRILRALRPAQ